MKSPSTHLVGLLASLLPIALGACTATGETRRAFGEAVFTATRVHRVELSLSDEDWQAMIAERGESQAYGDPPRTYYSARLRFDGESLPGPVGLRLKGRFALIQSIGHRFPFKIDFDRYVDAQTLNGLGKLNLHPDFELSSVAEFLSYGAIRDFGVPTVRTAFARVTVNGEELGLYGLVENVDGKFIRNNFPPPWGDLYKPELPYGDLSYRGPSLEDYPSRQHKWPDETDEAAFLELVRVLHEGSLARVADVLDIEAALRYLAVNVGIGNPDSYATMGHNYYLYERTPGRFTMVPWDMDISQIAGLPPCGHPHDRPEFQPPISRRLLGDPAHWAEYCVILREFLAGPASIAKQNDRLDTALALVGSELPSAEGVFRARIRDRVNELLDALADSAQPPCFSN